MTPRLTEITPVWSLSRASCSRYVALVTVVLRMRYLFVRLPNTTVTASHAFDLTGELWHCAGRCFCTSGRTTRERCSRSARPPAGRAAPAACAWSSSRKRPWCALSACIDGHCVKPQKARSGSAAACPHTSLPNALELLSSASTTHSHFAKQSCQGRSQGQRLVSHKQMHGTLPGKCPNSVVTACLRPLCRAPCSSDWRSRSVRDSHCSCPESLGTAACRTWALPSTMPRANMAEVRPCNYDSEGRPGYRPTAIHCMKPVYVLQ